MKQGMIENAGKIHVIIIVRGIHIAEVDNIFLEVTRIVSSDIRTGGKKQQDNQKKRRFFHETFLERHFDWQIGCVDY
jgi:UDP-N-acetylglucosamine 2-epimerase